MSDDVNKMMRDAQAVAAGAEQAIQTAEHARWYLDWLYAEYNLRHNQIERFERLLISYLGCAPDDDRFGRFALNVVNGNITEAEAIKLARWIYAQPADTEETKQ